ncbi:uncharacterized protein LOC109949499 [Prunus persica]|uniref:uncharacterized protein LOC109949499 n=1 Tax=Prunus persica TaxID=3760 RepID=UPI0009AB8456|nr:uncharacterized protein LOC109949499 [Prunus persica]
MKDLGDLNYFLGIEVARSTTGIFLSQRKYVLDLLTETGMLGCKPVDTSIEMNHKLCEDMDQEQTNKKQNVVDQILRYLKLAPEKGLMFSKNRDFEVVGYTDADWADSVTDRSSTSGYFTFVGGFTINLGKGQILDADGLKLAAERGISNLVVEMDSATAVQLLQRTVWLTV